MFQDTTPSAFRKHGSGYLGYVGDTKLEHGTQALIVAMLGKLLFLYSTRAGQDPAPLKMGSS